MVSLGLKPQTGWHKPQKNAVPRILQLYNDRKQCFVQLYYYCTIKVKVEDTLVRAIIKGL